MYLEGHVFELNFPPDWSHIGQSFFCGCASMGVNAILSLRDAQIIGSKETKIYALLYQLHYLLD